MRPSNSSITGKKQIVFLLYDSRSGSTFLSSLLDAYPDIAVSVESNFMRPLLLNQAVVNGAVSPDVVWEILTSEDRFGNLKIDEVMFKTALFRRELLSLGYIVETLLDVYTAKHDAQVYIVKDGANGYLINQIGQAMPSARFIHIIRDGRAVYNSKMKTTRPYAKGEKMARDPLTAARLWRSLVQNIDHFAARNSGRVLTVQYEKLVSEPQARLDEIRTFLKLPPMAPPADSKYFEKIPEKEKTIHGLVQDQAVMSRIDGWRSELGRDNLLIFEHFAGDALMAHGYQPINLSNIAVKLVTSNFLVVYVKSWLLRFKDWAGMVTNPNKAKRILQNKLLRRKE